MIISVKLFARTRELLGTDQIQVDLPDSATVATLRATLAAQHPRLAAFLPVCRVAVDSDFADDHLILSTHSEVAIIPPVSGG